MGSLTLSLRIRRSQVQVLPSVPLKVLQNAGTLENSMIFLFRCSSQAWASIRPSKFPKASTSRIPVSGQGSEGPSS
jgi:hypothetical protein